MEAKRHGPTMREELARLQIERNDLVRRLNERAPYLPPADVETLREIGEKMETGTDYLLDRLRAIIAKLEGAK